MRLIRWFPSRSSWCLFHFYFTVFNTSASTHTDLLFTLILHHWKQHVVWKEFFSFLTLILKYLINRINTDIILIPTYKNIHPIYKEQNTKNEIWTFWTISGWPFWFIQTVCIVWKCSALSVSRWCYVLFVLSHLKFRSKAFHISWNLIIFTEQTN